MLRWLQAPYVQARRKKRLRAISARNLVVGYFKVAHYQKSGEVEARSIDPLCYAASSITLVRDVGIENVSQLEYNDMQSVGTL